MDVAFLIREYFRGVEENISIDVFDAHTLNSVYSRVIGLLTSHFEIETSVLQTLSYCFYEILDNVHIHRAYGIGVEMVVHIVDVLASELISVVIYFVLYIERTIHVGVRLVTDEGANHMVECLIRELHHLMDMLVLLADKVFLAIHTAINGTCYVVAAVSNAFQFGDFAQHGTYFCFRVVG